MRQNKGQVIYFCGDLKNLPHIHGHLSEVEKWYLIHEVETFKVDMGKNNSNKGGLFRSISNGEL